jgi:enamine deaminase RidA (YjgF/YER057c/UK114 family)
MLQHLHFVVERLLQSRDQVLRADVLLDAVAKTVKARARASRKD